MPVPDTNPKSGGETDPSTDKEDVKNEGGKTFTQIELGQKLSEERKRLREQFQKEMDEAVQKAVAESERKAKLSEEEKAKEAQKAEREALDKREREITLRERKAEAIETLTSKNIPRTFADYVIDEDSDTMADNIDKLGKVWSEELEKAVKDAAKSKTPADKTNDANMGKSHATPSNVFRGSDGSAAF